MTIAVPVAADAVVRLAQPEQSSVHRLKSKLGSLCAPEARLAAVELDAAAKAAEWGRMEREVLERDLKQLEVAFDDLLG